MKSVIRKARRILDAAMNTKSDQIFYRLEEVQLHTSGYAEPGYDDPDSGLIATGNWNPTWRGLEPDDQTMPRVARLLEKLGIELEWCDEWTFCTKCHKLVRTEANSYDWTPSYYELDGEIVCEECATC